MRKTIFTLFAGMLSMASFAQTNIPEYLLDSTIVGNDVQLIKKQVYEYNANGQQTARYDYQLNTMDREPSLNEMLLTFYNSNGVKEREECYRGTTKDLYWTEEVTEYDTTNGQPSVTIRKLKDNNTSEMVQSEKMVVTKFHGNDIEDMEDYQWTSDDWMLIGLIHYEYNEDGTIGMQSATVFLGPFSIVSKNTYEYDEHGNVIKSTNTMEPEGMFEDDGVRTYENEYDENGNLKKVTPYHNGLKEEYTMYYWSKPGQASIHNPKVGSGLSVYYDLQGRRLGTVRPTQQGIYIVNGKKISLKK